MITADQPYVGQPVHLAPDDRMTYPADPPPCVAGIVTRLRPDGLDLTLFTPTGSMTDTAHRATATPDDWAAGVVHDASDCGATEPYAIRAEWARARTWRP